MEKKSISVERAQRMEQSINFIGDFGVSDMSNGKYKLCVLDSDGKINEIASKKLMEISRINKKREKLIYEFMEL
jgi:hypothetical protein